MRAYRHFFTVFTLAALLLTGACAGNDKTDAAQTDETVPVEQMYNDAVTELEKSNYTTAARLFDDVDRLHPYSQWSVRAQLMSGYAHYRNMKYDEAVLALDRFIELHPGDQNIDYAYYLRALCFYEQISDVRRDQRMTEMALENLRQIVTRFPDSRYARDAALKIDLTTDHLAGKEMEIGRYYLERKQYQAAINRFQSVVTRFQTTTHVPEALHRLVEIYTILGVHDEARKNAAILGHNYPDSSWYRDTYGMIGAKELRQRTVAPPARPVQEVQTAPPAFDATTAFDTTRDPVGTIENPLLQDDVVPDALNQSAPAGTSLSPAEQAAEDAALTTTSTDPIMR